VTPDRGGSTSEELADQQTRDPFSDGSTGSETLGRGGDETRARATGASGGTESTATAGRRQDPTDTGGETREVPDVEAERDTFRGPTNAPTAEAIIRSGIRTRARRRRGTSADSLGIRRTEDGGFEAVEVSRERAGDSSIGIGGVPGVREDNFEDFVDNTIAGYQETVSNPGGRVVGNVVGDISGSETAGNTAGSFTRAGLSLPTAPLQAGRAVDEAVVETGQFVAGGVKQDGGIPGVARAAANGNSEAVDRLSQVLDVGRQEAEDIATRYVEVNEDAEFNRETLRYDEPVIKFTDYQQNNPGQFAGNVAFGLVSAPVGGAALRAGGRGVSRAGGAVRSAADGDGLGVGARARAAAGQTRRDLRRFAADERAQQQLVGRQRQRGGDADADVGETPSDATDATAPDSDGSPFDVSDTRFDPERRRREERNEIARQQQEQVEFETQQRFGDEVRDRVPEFRDEVRTRSNAADDIDDGVSGEGNPQTAGDSPVDLDFEENFQASRDAARKPADDLREVRAAEERILEEAQEQGQLTQAQAQRLQQLAEREAELASAAGAGTTVAGNEDPTPNEAPGDIGPAETRSGELFGRDTSSDVDGEADVMGPQELSVSAQGAGQLDGEQEQTGDQTGAGDGEATPAPAYEDLIGDDSANDTDQRPGQTNREDQRPAPDEDVTPRPDERLTPTPTTPEPEQEPLPEGRAPPTPTTETPPSDPGAPGPTPDRTPRPSPPRQAPPLPPEGVGSFTTDEPSFFSEQVFDAGFGEADDLVGDSFGIGTSDVEDADPTAEVGGFGPTRDDEDEDELLGFDDEDDDFGIPPLF
jgi:hypothetical protein